MLSPVRCLVSLSIGGSVIAGAFAACVPTSSEPGPADATVDAATDAATLDASVNDASLPDGSAGADAGLDAPLADAAPDASDAACPPSTCGSVEVKFIGWVDDGDGGIATTELRVDDAVPDGGPNGTIRLAAAAASGPLQTNVLAGSFVTDADGGVVLPPQYAADNNYCNVPNFRARANAYYLAPMQGLPIEPTWGAACPCGNGYCGQSFCDDAGTPNMCDHEVMVYAQSCPNYGFNCVDTPYRIEEMRVVATSADSTCKVCLYDSISPSPGALIRCVSPGTTLTKNDLRAASADGGVRFPALIRLDDGTSCGSY